MTPSSTTFLALLFAFLLAHPLSATPASPVPQAWDVCADTWAASDGLGRGLPPASEAGPPKSGRTVGIFFFLWSEGQGEVHDLSRILAGNPAQPAFGPVQSFHHWGEPLFGYYREDDASVLRKQIQMLDNAGVDVLILDVTNAFTYDRVRDALVATLDARKALGMRSPGIAFLANSKSAKTVQHLYDTFYKPGLGRDHWFLWQGKPLLLSPPDGLSDEVRAFFTLRHSWAWTKGQAWFGDGRDKWPWLDHTPQTPGWHDSPDHPEQISVCVAEHPTSTIGRSFHDGRQPPPEQWRTAEGLHFAEQWKRAREVDPPFVFITGWNEWIAQRFVNEKGGMTLAGRKLGPGDSFFVDQYSPEFSRDIEPMKGGFGDAYYYQMVTEIRRYKGTRTLPQVRPVTVVIDGSFDDWKAAYPVFRDTLGDPVHRDHDGWKNQPRFVDQSGRNDIAEARVSADADSIFFHVRSREALTPPEGGDWMLLLIDSDHNPATGWLGYDWVVNHTPGRPGFTTLERHEGQGFQWGSPIEVPCRVAGDQIEVALPRGRLAPPGGPLVIDFKWADHFLQAGDWSDFTLHGDAAPDDRFNFRALIAPVRQ